MAGMIGGRLRLTTSRTPSYWRAGVKIGSTSAPTFADPGKIEPEQLLAILRDPVIVIAVEGEEGEFSPLSDEERGLAAASSEPQTDTAEPQGEGLTPGTEASQADGPDATAEDSAVSADGAVTPEPTAPELAPAPEPAAEPKPATRASAKKAKGTAT